MAAINLASSTGLAGSAGVPSASNARALPIFTRTRFTFSGLVSSCFQI